MFKNLKYSIIYFLYLPSDSSAQTQHEKVQNFIQELNTFNIKFETLTDNWKLIPMKKMTMKKQYEVESLIHLVDDVLQGSETEIIDFGCGLGNFCLRLFEKFGYTSLGIDCADMVQKAKERQQKYFPKSIGKVKFVQHFLNAKDSGEFILSHIDDDSKPLTFFGLHGCGDLTVTSIKLFLNVSRVKKLIFLPCCYHKMSRSVSSQDSDIFNLFPLSSELTKILKNYPNFLNRPFLRLAGQQSPAKFKDMSVEDHWIHGKNMMERALVESLLSKDETAKRVNSFNIPENRVTFDDIEMKYQLLDQSCLPKDWTKMHRQRFEEIRAKFPDGEEMSEKLFCLQTMLQSNSESLVLIDRIRFIEEEAKRMNLELKVSVKKLQNDKLSPRCIILIVEKL